MFPRGANEPVNKEGIASFGVNIATYGAGAYRKGAFDLVHDKITRKHDRMAHLVTRKPLVEEIYLAQKSPLRRFCGSGVSSMGRNTAE